MDKSELALIITAQAEQAISTLNKVNTQLNSMSKGLTSLKSTTGTALNGVNAGFNSFGKTVDRTSTKVSTLGTKLGRLFKLAFSLYALRKIASLLSASYEQAVNYTETLNLFNTAIGSNLQDASKPYQDFIDKGRAFQEEMRATFGTNMQEMMNYQGMFTAISKSLGLTEKSAYMVGKSLNSLSLDLSSLYNRDIKTVNEALKSGLVGQTKPVRSLGMDITERTLNNELKSMGIRNRSVAQMSQTEKVILRYNTMLKQSAVAHGDFAKTIETPANQLRIFKNQLSEIKMWLGNVFYGTMAKILPFINGFAMALKEVIKTIALFFGFKENIFGGAQYDLSDAYGTDNLSSGLDDSAKKAKKLNDQLMGFDEINNISTQESSGGGNSGVGGIGGGIDPRLLKSMKEYENTMKGVRTQALDIRDKILEWLGFTITTNEKTGEISLKLNEGYTNIEKIRDAIKLFLGTLLVFKGLKIFANIISDITLVGGVLSKFGGILKALILPALSGIWSVIVAIATALGISVGWVIAIIVAVVALIVLIVKFRKEIWEFIKMVGEKIAEAFKTALDFIIGVFKKIWDIISPTVDFIMNTFINPIKDAIVWVFKFVYDIISTIVKNIIAVISKIIEIVWTIMQIFIALGQAVYTYVIKPIIDFFVKLFKTIYDFVAPFVKKFIDAFLNIVTFIKNKIIDPIVKFFGKMIDKIVGFFRLVGEKVADAVSWVIKSALNGLFGIVEKIVNTFIKGLNAVLKIINAIPGVEIKTIKELKLTRFADGGLPQVGSMFIAREAGPEMVGNIGNRTAVVNNDQIVQAVSQGVASAVSRVMGTMNNGNQTFELYIDGEKMTNTVIKKINSKTQQFGNSPLRG